MKDPDDWPPAAGPLPAQVRSILAEVTSKLVADVRDGSYEDLDDYLSTATGAIFADEGPLDLTLRQAQRWRVLYSAVQALHDDGLVAVLPQRPPPGSQEARRRPS